MLANGTVCKTSHSEESDLFRALKGGGSNFGIITKVYMFISVGRHDFDTAIIGYDRSELGLVMQAVSEYAEQAPSDPHATVSVTFAMSGKDEKVSIVALVTYLGNISESTTLRPFWDIKHRLLLAQRMTPRQLGELLDQNNPKGYRYDNTVASQIHY